MVKVKQISLYADDVLFYRHKLKLIYIIYRNIFWCMFLSSELMKEQKHKLFYSCNHEAAEHSLTSWDNKHPVNKIMFSYLTVKFVSKYFWNDTNFPQLIISKYQNKWNACYNNMRDKTREAETMQQVLPHCTSCFLWHGHVFPPPQSAHGLTLSQTNWSFLCEYRTFNPSETWHAVLSSMNASLLDLSLCCVLGGQQGDVLPWTQLRHSHVQVRNSFNTRGRWRWPRCASVCSLMQIITCVLYPVSLSSLGFVDIALVEVEAGGAACLCTHI